MFSAAAPPPAIDFVSSKAGGPTICSAYLYHLGSAFGVGKYKNFCAPAIPKKIPTDIAAAIKSDNVTTLRQHHNHGMAEGSFTAKNALGIVGRLARILWQLLSCLQQRIGSKTKIKPMSNILELSSEDVIPKLQIKNL